MTAISAGERRPSGNLGDVVASVQIRGFFFELIEILSDLHKDVEVQFGPVDIRAEYKGKCVCRIVPYRELVHLHIGESPVWEVRVRDEAAYLDAVDRIIDVYLSFVAAASRPVGRHGGSTLLNR
jgi:hypothetical protein